MSDVIVDELAEFEQKLLRGLTAWQRQLLKEIVAAGGVMYRFRLKDRAHPTFRVGDREYPAGDDADQYAAYDGEIRALVEKRILLQCGSDFFYPGWVGWRIARALVAAD